MTFSSASGSSNAHRVRANLSPAVEPKENKLRTHMWHVLCMRCDGMRRERKVEMPQRKREVQNEIERIECCGRAKIESRTPVNDLKTKSDSKRKS